MPEVIYKTGGRRRNRGSGAQSVKNGERLESNTTNQLSRGEEQVKVRATISLTIDTDEAREMGLEIEADQVEEYALGEMLDYLDCLYINNEAHKVINIEVLEEEKANG